MNDLTKELVNLIGNAEDVLLEEPMSKHTTFRTGGNADFFISLNKNNITNLPKVLKFAKDNNLPYLFIGNGSNVLFSDNGFRGIVFLLKSLDDYEIFDDYVYASSGISLSRLSKIFQENGITGLEFACGIPGTLGGAIFMNAGAYGGEIKDIVLEVQYLDLNDMQIHTLTNEELEFDYRKSIFQTKIKDALIINAKLKKVMGDKEKIKETMDMNMESRNLKQPVSLPSAGSTFRREEGIIVAKLIDEAGLKGYSIGGAEVSTLHAGFIVNKNNATTKDILDLINYVKKVIKEKYNVELHEEVRIIGEK